MPKRTVVGSGRMVPLNMRTTEKLRKQINGAAGKSGRSLVQEVSYRVEESFRRDKTFDLVSTLAKDLSYVGHLESLAASTLENQRMIGKINLMWSDVMRRLDEIDARLISMRTDTSEPPLHPEMLNG